MKKKRKNETKEPVASYPGSKNISISHSFEEEDRQIIYWSGLTPEQRFVEFYNLMNRFFTFHKPDWSTKKIIMGVDEHDLGTLTKRFD